MILANKLHNSSSSGALRGVNQGAAVHSSIDAQNIEQQRTRIKEVAANKKTM
jgi:hypothetical protein